MLLLDYYNLMQISHTDIMPLLDEVLSLTRCEQRVFVYCLINCPKPVYYSSDIRIIADTLSLHVRTVERALRAIRFLPHLGACVQPRKYNHREELYYDEREREIHTGENQDREEY